MGLPLGASNFARCRGGGNAVQDALYNAWRALPRFRGEAKFSTWLYRIVWRQCVDRARRRRPLSLEEGIVASDQSSDPATRFESVETRDEVEQALRRLSVPYRTVLTLFYMEDLPIKEIADIVGLPQGTVKTHLHRARKELRNLLYPAVKPPTAARCVQPNRGLRHEHV